MDTAKRGGKRWENRKMRGEVVKSGRYVERGGEKGERWGRWEKV
ncbi:hypothetical protein R9C00_19060 [Flammeovirgaceae bacterium SG7u.111]|nr:hypothetical protein [Flammeovirgaceae bacterium SG7u.132]WPO33801.1 hypothetical protein R9C00_19060 [Flammeovirgaceae bacterium SG7u.111]